MPSSSSTTSITINLSRSLTSSEQSSFAATLVVKESSNELSNHSYTLASGSVKSGTTTKGSYTFGTGTIVITLSSAAWPQSFAISSPN